MGRDQSAIEGECHMPQFIITGCYSATSAKGMIDNPSDREAASRGIIEAAGGKLHSFYITTGETDWMAIVEFADGADLIPVLLVTGASGAVSMSKPCGHTRARNSRPPNKKRLKSNLPIRPRQVK